jgi:[NiFe] hydrogenase diaphorase moiety small subunit
MVDNVFNIDEEPIPFVPGQTIIEAAKAAGVYIPHLCFQPDFKRHGGCKLCTVLVNGRTQTACTYKAAVGLEVDVNTPELDAMRRSLVQMLFIEGNHFCPSCEKSGACQLQALGYEYEMMSPHFVELYPHREVDASHPDVLIDFNRCILCELCVRASRDVDQKEIFAIAGRGLDAKLIINSPTGKLGDSAFAVTDRAASVCPVGAILIKNVGFATAIGARPYDLQPISAEADSCEVPETT